MRNTFVALLLAIIALQTASAQVPLKFARTSSRQSLVFRVPADSAAEYLLKERVFVDQFQNHQPAATWPSGKPDYAELPIGHYLVFSIDGHRLIYEYYNQTRLTVRPFNNNERVQIGVFDSLGNPVANARAWVDGREMRFIAAIGGFEIPGKDPDYSLVKVSTPGDTAFIQLSSLDDQNSRWQQWWARFSRSGPVAILNRGQQGLRNFFNPDRPRGHRFSRNGRKLSGYMIFNQAIYKPGDSVKFKAYIVDAHNRRFRKPLTVLLSYSQRNVYHFVPVGRVKPSYPGSYHHEFILADSLPTDTRYSVLLRNGKDRVVLSSTFKGEDYLNNEVATYSVTPGAKKYYRGDTLSFSVKAMDANGLPVMDGKVRFSLTGDIPWAITSDEVFIADTLYYEEKRIATDGSTIITIPSSVLPGADLELTARAEILNSNNEVQWREVTVEYADESSRIIIRRDGAWLDVSFLDKGKAVDTTGTYSFEGSVLPYPIRFPARIRIHPEAEEYEFEAGDACETFELNSEQYRPVHRIIQEKDSCGFMLDNPLGLQIHYTVFDGGRVVDNRADSATQIIWKQPLTPRKIYQVVYNLRWSGAEQSGSFSIAALDKLLSAGFVHKDIVSPGEDDPVTVVVTDRKGRPARNVNLTAVTYNAQHEKDLNVAEPPYLDRMRSKTRIMNNRFEYEEAALKSGVPLAAHRGWETLLGADSMIYFQLLHGAYPYKKVSSVIADPMPQVAIHLIRNGQPKEIRFLFINNRFVWYNKATEQPAYVFHALHGYNSFGLRLDSSFVVIDSIFLQPYYKYDIVFDQDHLPAKTVVTKMSPELTSAEEQMLDQTMLQLDMRSGTRSSWIWQNDKLLNVTSGRLHLVGPFERQDSIQFYEPKSFDLRFPFEPGYRYRVSPRMVRLEKIPREKDKKPVQDYSSSSFNWILGDTIYDKPAFDYSLPEIIQPYLSPVSFPDSMHGTARLVVKVPRNRRLTYLIIYDSTSVMIRNSSFDSPVLLSPGRYNLVLVTDSMKFLRRTGVVVRDGGLTAVGFDHLSTEDENAFVRELHEQAIVKREQARNIFFESLATPRSELHARKLAEYPEGNIDITGSVRDKLGQEAVPRVFVELRGFAGGVVADEYGRFSMKVKPGRYTLLFSSVGYGTTAIAVNATNEAVHLVVELTPYQSELDEVVVVGYGTQRKRSMTGSVSIIGHSLSGSVAGVSVGATNTVRVRGAGTISSAQQLIILDGVPVTDMPDESSLTGARIEVLNPSAAMAIYGSEGANGVVIITTTGNGQVQMRNKFRDYAAWQPDLITDREGRATFSIHYPDNITGWITYVVGMDKKRRYVKASTFTRSFKLLVTQLSGPAFLVDGDSALLAGKILNRTSANAKADWTFNANGTVYGATVDIGSDSSATQDLPLTVTGTDTIAASFSMKLADGSGDGEELRIPVIKRGVVETSGEFLNMVSDTAFVFKPVPGAGRVYVHAVNNALDLLSDELEKLENYPYSCVEQMTSKFRGLLLKQQIGEKTGQSFNDSKTMNSLMEKIQSAQLYDGGWPWWPGGASNAAITNYVVRTLVEVQVDGLKTSLRNGLLYLELRLQRIKSDEDLLDALQTLSEAKHGMNYNQYLDRMLFDSLTVHQQWQFTRIRQMTGLPITRELQKLMKIKRESFVGAVYWGEEGYKWTDNCMATTNLAFRVLALQKGYDTELQGMLSFFLGRRKTQWGNTVESASVTANLLSYVLGKKADFTAPARLAINGELVGQFPFTACYADQMPLTIDRSGGGILFMALSQDRWVDEPVAVNDKFDITTWFETNGKKSTSLTAGTASVMKIRIDVKKDAEFVQVEVPVPAGCTYAMKKQDLPGIHKEYLKDRMMFFVEWLKKGSYTYEIGLEPRYAGIYHLNPAKSALMYFPVFFGRTGIKTIHIKK